MRTKHSKVGSEKDPQTVAEKGKSSNAGEKTFEDSFSGGGPQRDESSWTAFP